MPVNHLFVVFENEYHLLDYVKGLLKLIPYSEQETSNSILFTIHFPSENEQTLFFADIKRNHPELLEKPTK